MTYQFVPLPMPPGGAPSQPIQPPWTLPPWAGGPPSWGGGQPAPPAGPDQGLPGAPSYGGGYPSTGPIYGGGHPSTGPIYGGGHPSTGPIYGGGYPSTGPIYGGGHPSQGLPWGPGHPSTGPIWGGEHPWFPIQLPIYPIGPGGLPTPMPPIYTPIPPSVQYVVCFTIAVPPGAVFPPPAPPDPTATPK